MWAMRMIITHGLVVVLGSRTVAATVRWRSRGVWCLGVVPSLASIHIQLWRGLAVQRWTQDRWVMRVHVVVLHGRWRWHVVHIMGHDIIAIVLIHVEGSWRGGGRVVVHGYSRGLHVDAHIASRMCLWL